ncbi:MAG: PAS domain-containing sensor histidine kinase [Bacteroidota bacterium]
MTTPGRSQANGPEKNDFPLNGLEAGQAVENALFKIIKKLDCQVFVCRKNAEGEYVVVFSEGQIAVKNNICSEQVRGERLKDITGPYFFSRLKPKYDCAFAGEIVTYKDFLYEGNFFSTTLMPFTRDEKGHVVEVLGETYDISRLYEVEKKQRENTEFLDRIIEYNPYSIQILDAEGHHLRANKAFSELFVAPPPDNWSLFDDPVVNDKHGDKLKEIMEGQMIHTRQTWYNAQTVNSESPDNPVCLNTVMFPVLSSDSGDLQNIIVMHEDITERVRTREALEKSEKHFKHLLSSNPAVIYTTEAEFPHHCSFISENVHRLTGFSSRDFLANPAFWWEQVHPDDYQTVQKRLPLTIERGYHIAEYRFRCKSGQYIWILDETRLTEEEQGKESEIIGYWIDISIRKRTDQELITAKEKAEESDRLKSAFLANMSHEIRTPMNGILGFAELLKNPRLSESEREEYTGIIKQSGDRLLDIMNDLISISKVEADQMDVHVSETNIYRDLDYIYHFFEGDARKKELQLIVSCPLSIEESVVYTDKGKLYAILTHLMKNAIKFTESGRIDIGCQRKGDFFEFYVEDTGIGIPASMQDSVLERFVQVDTGAARNYEGAGLGLSIVRAYVELLGGRIWLESEEGSGSVFYFTIPAVQQASDT